jgi:hypothetical protein
MPGVCSGKCNGVDVDPENVVHEGLVVAVVVQHDAYVEQLCMYDDATLDMMM